MEHLPCWSAGAGGDQGNLRAEAAADLAEDKRPDRGGSVHEQPLSRLPAVLNQIDMISPGPPIRILAQTARPTTVRSLDAIGLGTALTPATY